MKCLKCGKEIHISACSSCHFNARQKAFSYISPLTMRSKAPITSLLKTEANPIFTSFTDEKMDIVRHDKADASRGQQAAKSGNDIGRDGAKRGSIAVQRRRDTYAPNDSSRNEVAAPTSPPRRKSRFLLPTITIVICTLIVLAIVKHTGLLSSSNNDLVTVTADASVGDIIVFGNYEQDADLSNGAEPIQWFVADISNGKALLVSEKCLDCMPYSIENNDSWTGSDVREWLNDDFYSNSFSAKEQDCIARSSLISGYPVLSSDYVHEENTNDKVFVLDFDEYKKYVAGDAKLSPYARGKYLAAINNADCKTYENSEEDYCSNESEYGENYCWCLLRNLGPIENTIQFVHWFDEAGIAAVGNGFCDASSCVAIRPVIWVYVDSNQASNGDYSTQSEPFAEELNVVDSTRFYNWELLHRDDENWNHKFGYNEYATYVSNMNIKTEEELCDYFHNKFCERLEMDPAFAASVMAYVDKNLHTRYAGQFGDVFSNASESEWIGYVNETKDSFISDSNLQIGESSALAELLSNCQISIVEMSCPIKHMTMFLGEDDTPQVSIETFQNHKIDAGAYKVIHAFTYEANIKGTVFPLYFCMECGFAPILYSQ